LNFNAGQIIGNAALVAICDPSTAACASDFTVAMGPASANIVIDVTGYLASSGLQVYTVTPCRAVDTRFSTGVLPVSGTRSFSVVGTLANQGGQPTCGIPYGAQAVFLNVVAVGPSATGYLTVYPWPETLPNASTLNFAAGQTLGNGTLVPICNRSTTTCTSD